MILSQILKIKKNNVSWVIQTFFCKSDLSKRRFFQDQYFPVKCLQSFLTRIGIGTFKHQTTVWSVSQVKENGLFLSCGESRENLKHHSTRVAMADKEVGTKTSPTTQIWFSQKEKHPQKSGKPSRLLEHNLVEQRGYDAGYDEDTWH